MRLKTFTAPSMKDAMRLIRAELGENAVILSSRPTVGADGSSALEVTAASDETPSVSAAPLSAAPAQGFTRSPSSPESADFRASLPSAERIPVPASFSSAYPPASSADDDFFAAPTRSSYPFRAPTSPTASSQSFEQEAMLSQVSATVANKGRSGASVSALSTPLATLLERHGVTPELVRKIGSAVEALVQAGFGASDALDMVLGKMVRFTPPARAFAKQKVHVFVGPSGGGKTTTLCKLAVSKKVEGQSIALFTLDNQKVGAFEQLDIFGNAMGEQTVLLKDPLMFLHHLGEMDGVREYIFMDTPGLNPLNPKQLALLKTKLAALNVAPEALAIHVVLPASLNPMEMAAVPVALADLSPASLIFTKLDETSYLGGVMNVAADTNLPVCFAADGPRVPDDLLELDAATLAQKLSTPPRMPWETMRTAV